MLRCRSLRPRQGRRTGSRPAHAGAGNELIRSRVPRERRNGGSTVLPGNRSKRRATLSRSTSRSTSHQRRSGDEAPQHRAQPGNWTAASGGPKFLAGPYVRWPTLPPRGCRCQDQHRDVRSRPLLAVNLENEHAVPTPARALRPWSVAVRIPSVPEARCHPNETGSGAQPRSLESGASRDAYPYDACALAIESRTAEVP